MLEMLIQRLKEQGRCFEGAGFRGPLIPCLLLMKGRRFVAETC